VAGARALAAQSLALTEETGFVKGRGWALQALGRIAHGTGDRHQARDRLIEALDVAQSIGAPLESASVHLSLAEVALGDPSALPAVTAHLQEAHRLAAAGKAWWYVERAERLGAKPQSA
jgi:hypothetical protein